ncbi:hypothetical protein NW754_008224 [Fusarium falciforme]|nr:hypothetical protein NW754_008224 [Fusarium falciforme]
MASFTIPVNPVAADGEDINLIDANRVNSPFSALIAEKVERAKADWEKGNHDTFATLLEEYIPLELMDIAMTTFNLLRIPFQTRRPFGDSFAGCLLPSRFKLTNAWNILHYFTDTFGNWNKFREFLELADKVRQLATAYCCVPDPETFWVHMDHLWEEASTQVVHPVGEDGLAEPLIYPRRCVTGIVRRVLMRNMENNPPGEQPKDLEGELIDPALFHHALRMNWEEERAQRSFHLLGLHRRGTVDLSESRPLLRQWKDSWSPINEFHWAVFRARGASICSRLNLNELQEARLLGELQWMNNYELGVQA